MEHVLAMLGTGDAYFWATHSGAELDLLVMRGGKRLGFEFKYTDAPKRTRSMQVAIQDLSLERLWVVYPGAKKYDLGERISVIPLKAASQVVGGPR